MASKAHRRLERDLKFLCSNLVPQKASGEKVDKLAYEGSSSDEEECLDDQNVRDLVDGLKDNDAFKGPLDLTKNKLTDLVSYNITFLMASNNYCSLAFISKRSLPNLDLVR